MTGAELLKKWRRVAAALIKLVWVLDIQAGRTDMATYFAGYPFSLSRSILLELQPFVLVATGVAVRRFLPPVGQFLSLSNRRLVTCCLSNSWDAALPPLLTQHYVDVFFLRLRTSRPVTLRGGRAYTVSPAVHVTRTIPLRESHLNYTVY